MQQQACALRPPHPQENPDGSVSAGGVGESMRVESEKDDDGKVVRMSVTFIKDTQEEGPGQVGDRRFRSSSSSTPMYNRALFQ